MKILVTGSTGLLGNNLIRELLSRGYDVTAMIEPGVKKGTLEGLRLNFVTGNILEQQNLEAAFRGMDYVFHAAASTNLYPNRSARQREINITGTRNVTEAILHAGVKRLIYVGTANTFGYGSREKPGDENTPYNYARYGLDYMDSKREAHDVVIKAVKEKGLDAVICNPTFMFGPYDSKPSSGAMILAVYNRKVPGYTAGGKNYVCIKDVVKAMANAIQMGRTGESYILGHVNLSFKEIFEKIAAVSGVRAPSIALPKFITKAYGRLGSLKAGITGKAPTVSYPMALMSCDKHYYTAQKAVRELQLPQSPIEEGIEDALRWFKESAPHLLAPR